MKEPHELLPLRPVEFEILLVLSAGDAHGYGIIKEAQERDPRGFRLETGTLYRVLRRLATQGLILPVTRRQVAEPEGERRSYYAITPFGRAVARAEARRLAAQVDAARNRELLARVEGGSR